MLLGLFVTSFGHLTSSPKERTKPYKNFAFPIRKLSQKANPLRAATK
jgi:hypothetical protein